MSYEHNESAPVQLDPVETSDKEIIVKIISPFKTYFDGRAQSLSGTNATGPFDILPQHANFMSLLTAGEVVVRSPLGERRFTVKSGLLRVHNNVAIVYLDV